MLNMAKGNRASWRPNHMTSISREMTGRRAGGSPSFIKNRCNEPYSTLWLYRNACSDHWQEDLDQGGLNTGCNQPQVWARARARGRGGVYADGVMACGVDGKNTTPILCPRSTTKMPSFCAPHPRALGVTTSRNSSLPILTSVPMNQSRFGCENQTSSFSKWLDWSFLPPLSKQKQKQNKNPHWQK